MTQKVMLTDIIKAYKEIYSEYCDMLPLNLAATVYLPIHWNMHLVLLKIEGEKVSYVDSFAMSEEKKGHCESVAIEIANGLCGQRERNVFLPELIVEQREGISCGPYVVNFLISELLDGVVPLPEGMTDEEYVNALVLMRGNHAKLLGLGAVNVLNKEGLKQAIVEQREITSCLRQSTLSNSTTVRRRKRRHGDADADADFGNPPSAKVVKYNPGDKNVLNKEGLKQAIVEQREITSCLRQSTLSNSTTVRPRKRRHGDGDAGNPPSAKAVKYNPGDKVGDPFSNRHVLKFSKASLAIIKNELDTNSSSRINKITLGYLARWFGTTFKLKNRQLLFTEQYAIDQANWFEVRKILPTDPRVELRGQFGLYTNRQFKQHEIMGIYVGDVTTNEENLSDKSAQLGISYNYNLRCGGTLLVINGGTDKGNWMARINANTNYKSKASKVMNCKGRCVYYKGWPLLLIVATENISFGQEVLMDYGEQYWEVTNNSTDLCIRLRGS